MFFFFARYVHRGARAKCSRSCEVHTSAQRSPFDQRTTKAWAQCAACKVQLPRSPGNGGTAPRPLGGTSLEAGWGTGAGSVLKPRSTSLLVYLKQDCLLAGEMTAPGRLARLCHLAVEPPALVVHQLPFFFLSLAPLAIPPPPPPGPRTVPDWIDAASLDVLPRRGAGRGPGYVIWYSGSSTDSHRFWDRLPPCRDATIQ